MKEPDIRRYTVAKLQAMRARGESQTDWAAVMAKTEEELEADIASDPDWAHIPRDWYKDAVMMGPLIPKKLLSVRLDPDVVDWFKAQGRGYQTRMNAVLRAYVQAQRAAKKAAE
jgi:uncharacterized protein (DUF4415 family)